MWRHRGGVVAVVVEVDVVVVAAVALDVVVAVVVGRGVVDRLGSSSRGRSAMIRVVVPAIRSRWLPHRRAALAVVERRLALRSRRGPRWRRRNGGVRLPTWVDGRWHSLRRVARVPAARLLAGVVGVRQGAVGTRLPQRSVVAMNRQGLGVLE